MKNFFRFFSLLILTNTHLMGQNKFDLEVHFGTMNRNNTNLYSHSASSIYGISYSYQLKKRFDIKYGNIIEIFTEYGSINWKNINTLSIGYKNKYLSPYLGISNFVRKETLGIENSNTISLMLYKKINWVNLFIAFPTIYNLTFNEIEAIENIIVGVSIPIKKPRDFSNDQVDLLFSLGTSISSNRHYLSEPFAVMNIQNFLSFGAQLYSKVSNLGISIERMIGISQIADVNVLFPLKYNYFGIYRKLNLGNHEFKYGLDYIYGYDYMAILKTNSFSEWGVPTNKGFSLNLGYKLSKNYEANLRCDYFTYRLDKNQKNFDLNNIRIGVKYIFN